MNRHIISHHRDVLSHQKLSESQLQVYIIKDISLSLVSFSAFLQMKFYHALCQDCQVKYPQSRRDLIRMLDRVFDKQMQSYKKMISSIASDLYTFSIDTTTIRTKGYLSIFVYNQQRKPFLIGFPRIKNSCTSYSFINVYILLI